GFRALSELADKPITLPASRFLSTGGHRASIKAVAEGRAQLAAIDAQSWRLATAHEPAAREVHVSGRSSNVPGLPLITAPAFVGLTPDLFEAMRIAIDLLPEAPRKAINIVGLVEARTSDYDVLTEPPFGTVSVNYLA
ncbi:MAG TPA: PhnD/SsuA/transferrin family substrate-binding protein, partial [Rhizobiaceae bacterium]|nr:PhnD/SsuA/transferrin family substrate-binding protein [Rhizobiaceae bacterium]